MLQDEESVQYQSPSQYLLAGYHSSDTEEEICATQPRRTGSGPHENKEMHVDSPMISESVANNHVEHNKTFVQMEAITKSNLKSTN